MLKSFAAVSALALASMFTLASAQAGDYNPYQRVGVYAKPVYQDYSAKKDDYNNGYDVKTKNTYDVKPSSPSYDAKVSGQDYRYVKPLPPVRPTPYVRPRTSGSGYYN